LVTTKGGMASAGIPGTMRMLGEAPPTPCICWIFWSRLILATTAAARESGRLGQATEPEEPPEEPLDDAPEEPAPDEPPAPEELPPPDDAPASPEEPAPELDAPPPLVLPAPPPLDPELLESPPEEPVFVPLSALLVPQPATRTVKHRQIPRFMFR